MVNETNVIYQFSRFRLDAANHRLNRDGILLQSSPKLLDLLRLLIENAGETLSTYEISTNLWPDLQVDHDDVDSQVATLKRLLEDRSKEDPLIRSIPGKGYRFEGKVSQVVGVDEEQVADAPVEEPVFEPSKAKLGGMLGVAAGVAVLTTLAVWGWHFVSNTAKAGSSSPNADQAQIAVLPLRSLSNNSNDERFDADLTAAIIASLGKGGKLKVLPAAAVQQFAQGGAIDPVTAGQTLGARVLVMGMVQRLGNHAWVKVQIVGTQDGTQLWSGGFDGQDTDIAGISERICEKVGKRIPASEGAESQ